MEREEYLNSYLTQLVKEFLTPRQAAQLKDLPLVGPGGLRRQLGGISLEFFARAYFPEYFTAPVARSTGRRTGSLMGYSVGRLRGRGWCGRGRVGTRRARFTTFSHR